MVLVSACKHLQNNQAVAWILKTKEKNPPKQVFLGTTVHRVGEKAEKQQKTKEKSKVAENQVFWLDFCAKKRTVHTPPGVTVAAADNNGCLASFKLKENAPNVHYIC